MQTTTPTPNHPPPPPTHAHTHTHWCIYVPTLSLNNTARFKHCLTQVSNYTNITKFWCVNNTQTYTFTHKHTLIHTNILKTFFYTILFWMHLFQNDWTKPCSRLFYFLIPFWIFIYVAFHFVKQFAGYLLDISIYHSFWYERLKISK